MSRVCLVFLLLWVGCAHRPPGRAYTVISQPLAGEEAAAALRATALESRWPRDGRAVQRVILSVGRRQYVMDGLLTASPDAGLRLAVVSPLGLVTEVACSPAGVADVLRTTPLLDERRAHEYVARDLAWLLGPAPENLQVGVLTDGRHVLETSGSGVRRRYVLAADTPQLQELEVIEGDRRIYHARFQRWQTFPPLPTPLPTLIDVDAGHYRLSVRTVQVSLPSTPAGRAQP